MADGPPLASNAQATTVRPTSESESGSVSSVSSASDPSAGSGSTQSTLTGVASASQSSGSVESPAKKSDRQVFGPEELAIVLSHYDIGVIEAVQQFPRGSRKAPKLILRTDTGLYLLKRRASGKNEPFKVAFAHSLQMHLAERQFPLPHLIGTKKENNSMLQWKGAIYELFEYIKGTSYDNSLEATTDAGKILSLFHKLLKEYDPEFEPPRGSYHASRSVASSMQQVPRTLKQTDPQGVGDNQAKLDEVVGFLNNAYNDAAKRVNDSGLPDWPLQIVHSDWHPGNMLFRGTRVVAVIDYDAARIQQPIIDAANGVLQFSILGGADDPSQWPDYIDETRFKRFIRGYESVPDQVLSRAEIRTVPWLMIEALIAESVIPIAATGSFARMHGMAFLSMVERKVHWLQTNAEKLIEGVEG